MVLSNQAPKTPPIILIHLWLLCNAVVPQSESQWCVKVCPVKCLCCWALYQAWGVEHHDSNAQHKGMTALAAFHPAVEWSMPASTRLSLDSLQWKHREKETWGHTIRKILNVSGVCQNRARDISWIFPPGFFRVRWCWWWHWHLIDSFSLISLSFSVVYAPYLQAEVCGGGWEKFFKMIMLQKQWLWLLLVDCLMVS